MHPARNDTPHGAQPRLSEEQVGQFSRDGFLVVEGMTSLDEIEALKPLYDGIVEAHLGFSPEAAAEALRRRNESLQAILPRADETEGMRRTRLYQNAVDVMTRLLGAEPSRVVVGLRLFLKPAGYAETRWHQDAAYRPPPYETLSAWIPLDSATPETGGCLSYLPGSHGPRRVHPHTGEGEHLILEDVDPKGETACPILPTAAVIHHCCTIHRAGPNRMGRPRRAIGIVCRTVAS